MCLLVAAWHVHPRYPLVLAANRDEYHARPAREAHAWDEPPGIIGGRDLEAGGTWLAAAQGRVAAVTNVQEAVAASGGERSRGGLPVDFLRADTAPSAHAQALSRRGGDYRGYNLLLADRAELALASNRLSGPQRLEPGVHAVSNARPGEDWPKAQRARAALRAALEDNGDRGPLVAAAFTLLAERARPEHGGDPRLHSIFVAGAEYGTRCSTVLLLGRDGSVSLQERRFDSAGQLAGESALELPPAP